jgi:hypothetical protein
MQVRIISIAAALTLAACSADETFSVPIHPLDASTRASLGSVGIDVTQAGADVDLPRPIAGEGAGAAALDRAKKSAMIPFLCMNDAHCALVGLVLGIPAAIIIAPIWVTKAALTAPPSYEDVDEAMAALIPVVTETDWTAELRDAVEQASRAGQGDPRVQTAASDSQLRLTIEGPWLVLEGETALPTLTVHGEFHNGASCLLDRHWRWNGESDDFFDLSADAGAAYNEQLRQGVAQLGKAIAFDILFDEPAHMVEYHSAAAAQGHAPLIVTEPLDHQEEIVAWETLDTQNKPLLRCASFQELHAESRDQDMRNNADALQTRDHVEGQNRRRRSRHIQRRSVRAQYGEDLRAGGGKRCGRAT